MKVPMGPPPPRIPNPNPDSNPNPDFEPSTAEPIPSEGVQLGGGEDKAEANQVSEQVAETTEKEAPENPNPSADSTPSVSRSSSSAVPYTIPPWSEHPGHPFFFEVLKDGTIIEQLDVSKKGAYMFGRIDLCDFVLEHPTISRFHAVLQFKKDGEVFLYDLGSTHGTFVNKSQVKEKAYTEVHVGDVIRFGQSSRLYIFQGPSELMPPEGDLKKIWNAKIQEEIQDREASLLRARVEASLVDGISWGMAEDAIEDRTENDADEITWQTFKGQLTERQEKTRGKIIKRIEKVANMRKEIDAIRTKDISQGGLTQGQQTQIARNEQRISQIMEELESLEETLNESIQESVGARKKVTHSMKKGTADDDEILSDDDEFFDRTKKKPYLKKSAEKQSIETADTLLDKKDIIIKEMGEKTNLLLEEKAKMVPESEGCLGEGDELDAYMTGLSSRLALDKTKQIQKELSTLQPELDRILYLLKIADPNGEAAKKRDAKLQASKSNHAETSVPGIPKQPASERRGIAASEKSTTVSSLKEEISHSLSTRKPPEDHKEVHMEKETKAPAYIVSKPQWLGAVKEVESTENPPRENVLDSNEADQFVDYKDRKKVLASVDDEQDIEHAAPGLIIRKRKHVGKSEMAGDGAAHVSTSSSEAESKAADAVALLLKHTRGYLASDSELSVENQTIEDEDQSQKKTTKMKRVMGPERPAFLDKSSDYESWVPPEGQSGDGRTSLNDRLGY